MDGTNMTPHQIIRAMRRDIESLRAQLAEKGRECERLRANIEAALGIAEKAEADTRDRPWRAIHAIVRALENDDG